MCPTNLVSQYLVLFFFSFVLLVVSARCYNIGCFGCQGMSVVLVQVDTRTAFFLLLLKFYCLLYRSVSPSQGLSTETGYYQHYLFFASFVIICTVLRIITFIIALLRHLKLISQMFLFHSFIGFGSFIRHFFVCQKRYRSLLSCQFNCLFHS